MLSPYGWLWNEAVLGLNVDWNALLENWSVLNVCCVSVDGNSSLKRSVSS